MTRVRLLRTDGIVLKRRDYGEADRVLTILTPSRGKVSAIAKGVRRLTSRKSGHLELFTHGSFLLARGRNLDTVTQVETLHTFAGLRDDLTRTTFAYHLAELSDRLTPEEQPAGLLFELLTAALAELATTSDPALLSRYVELHMLGLLGYQPQLYRCVECADDLAPDGNRYSVADGGVLCPDCGPQAATSIPLSGTAFRALRFMQRRGWADVARLELSQTTRTEIERLMLGTLRQVLERDLSSVAFLDDVRRLPDKSIHIPDPVPVPGPAAPGAAPS